MSANKISPSAYQRWQSLISVRPEYYPYSELEKLNKRIVLFYALLDTLSRPVLLTRGAGLTFLQIKVNKGQIGVFLSTAETGAYITLSLCVVTSWLLSA